MHKAIRRLLPDSVGESQLVIAANVDVRGFTRFSETQDSVLALMYIRKVYERILSEYFADAAFFKLTGDGLLLVFPWTDQDLKQVVRSVVADSLSLVTKFPRLVADDPSISFKVPTDVGIGLARGAASRLRTRSTTLDYSGRPLNLASRLMDLARPGGVVTDANFGIHLLTKKTQEKFETDEVFVPGLAEREPMKVLFTSGHTKISPKSKQPILESEWERIRDDMQVKDFRDLGPVFTYLLTETPIDIDDISVEIRVPLHRGGKRVQEMFSTFPVNFEYEVQAGEPVLELRYDAAVTAMRGSKIPWNRPATLYIDYPRA